MPIPILKHKQALFEIFTSAMEGGQPLYGLCDGILRSALAKVPAWNTFITLGEFSASDVKVGRMQKKFRVVSQDILAVGVIRDIPDGEDVAEFDSFELARGIRTVLSANRTLISTSYPSGIAIESELSDSKQVFVVIQDMITVVQWLGFRMKVVED